MRAFTEALFLEVIYTPLLIRKCTLFPLKVHLPINNKLGVLESEPGWFCYRFKRGQNERDSR